MHYEKIFKCIFDICYFVFACNSCKCGKSHGGYGRYGYNFGKTFIGFKSWCDYLNVKYNTNEFQYVSGTTLKCAHGKTEWKVTKPATCTAKGTETGTCSCGNVSTRDIPKTEHTVGKYTITKEPTCTEKGTKKAVCTVCNKEYIEKIKATGHTYGKRTVEKEATETEKGLKKAECTVCGDIKEKEIPIIVSPTEPTTFVENATDEPSSEEPSTQVSSGNVEEEKPSTAKTVVLTILATLGVEAIVAGLIILILKQRKKEKEQ